MHDKSVDLKDATDKDEKILKTPENKDSEVACDNKKYTTRSISSNKERKLVTDQEKTKVKSSGKSTCGAIRKTSPPPVKKCTPSTSFPTVKKSWNMRNISENPEGMNNRNNSNNQKGRKNNIESSTKPCEVNIPHCEIPYEYKQNPDSTSTSQSTNQGRTRSGGPVNDYSKNKWKKNKQYHPRPNMKRNFPAPNFPVLQHIQQGPRWAHPIPYHHPVVNMPQQHIQPLHIETVLPLMSEDMSIHSLINDNKRHNENGMQTQNIWKNNLLQVSGNKPMTENKFSMDIPQILV